LADITTLPYRILFDATAASTGFHNYRTMQALS
jgi:hypothetical protein